MKVGLGIDGWTVHVHSVGIGLFCCLYISGSEFFNYNLLSHILATYEFNIHDLGLPDLAALLFVLVLAEGNEGFQVIDFSD